MAGRNMNRKEHRRKRKERSRRRKMEQSRRTRCKPLLLTDAEKDAQAREKEAKRKNRPKKKKWDYYKYLKSKEWQRKRREAFKHYGRKCQLCGTEIGEMHVHHKSYQNLGYEPMADLGILCKGCHENEHEGEKVACRDPLTREFLNLHL